MDRQLVEALAYSPDCKDYTDTEVSISEIIIKETGTGNLHGLHLSKESASKGVVLHFHGSGFNVTKHIGHVDWMVGLGFNVIMFDYPGYGKSDGYPTRKNVLEAADHFFNYVDKEFPNQPIILFGQSLGGAILIEYVSKSKLAKENLIILDSTFSKYSEIAKLKLIRNGTSPEKAEKLSTLLTSEHDPINHISNITSPILILHSQDDSIVPIDEALRLSKKVSNDFEFWIQNATGHTGVFRENHQDYRVKLINWIDSHIG